MLLDGNHGRNKKATIDAVGTERLVPAALSDIGIERSVNEDRFDIIESASGTLWLVLDGMGGVAGGEFAAQLGIDAARRYIEQHGSDQPEVALAGVVEEANRIVVLRRQNQAYASMGTTIVGVLINQFSLALTHVGDSRAYVVRDGEINQLTVDHTYVQELVERQELRREDALTHPQSHILTQCLGLSSTLRVEPQRYWIWPTEEGASSDVIVLCSDGLYSLVSDDEIALIVSTLVPHTACEELIKLANARGGYDNITVAVIPVCGTLRDEVPPGFDRHIAQKERKERIRTWRDSPVVGHVKIAAIASVAAAVLTVASFFLVQIFSGS
jgi:protein phosphatase